MFKLYSFSLFNYLSFYKTIYRFNKIAVGISGGIDSAITAKLLQDQGYSVYGFHMQNWDLSGDESLHNSSNISCIERDVNDAKLVCKILNIPFYRVSFSKEYWENIWEIVVNDYQNGLTPNPDILCNKYIKAGCLPEYVKKHFDINKVATGHYTKKQSYITSDNKIKYKLIRGNDLTKDQTYFLSQLSQSQLQSLEFPLGEYTKEQIKSIASTCDLKFLLEKKESMGICFIGKRKHGFDSFLSQYISPKEGNIIYNNKIIGTHKGIHTLTIGQKARIGGGSEKLYCIKKNYNKNLIIVGKKSQLQSTSSIISNINWISDNIPNEIQDKKSFDIDVQLHNLGVLIPARISNYYKYNKFKITYKSIIHEIVAPGQYIVFFKDNECLGSGKVI